MNTSNKIPAPGPKDDPKVDKPEQDVVTNSEESNKVVNQDNAVADTESVERDPANEAPSTEPNTEARITNNESDVITNSDTSNDITPEV